MYNLGQMKAIRSFYYSILLLAFSVSFLGASETEQKEYPVPHPLELKQNWWKYFDVPEDKIKGNLDAFKKELLELQASLKDESHKDIHKLIDQVFLMLDLVLQKRQEVQPSKPTELKLLPHYSLKELLQVHEKRQLAKIEIEAKRNKINILESRVNRTQTSLDRAIIQYQSESPATFEKLKQGMEIIELRAELALQSIELQQEREGLNYALKKRDQLREELKAANRTSTARRECSKTAKRESLSDRESLTRG